MHDVIKIKDIFFCENLDRPLVKDTFQHEKNLFSKHDLEIKIIDSVYTDGAPAIFGIYFCFVRSS